MRRLSLVCATIVLGAATAGCGTAVTWGPQPSASVTTASPGWESRFRVTYEAEPVGTNTTRVSGYLHNTYGDAFGDVLLLVQALHASGQVVGQRVTRLPGVLAGFSRSYFQVANLPAAEHYRVTVWSYSPIQAPSWPD